jgi:hypothetical protein
MIRLAIYFLVVMVCVGYLAGSALKTRDLRRPVPVVHLVVTR